MTRFIAFDSVRTNNFFLFSFAFLVLSENVYE